MMGQVTTLEAQVKAFRAAYFAKDKAASPLRSPMGLHAGVMEAIDDLRRDMFVSMANMVTTLGMIGRRLPAVPVLRPQLRHDAKKGEPAAVAAAAATTAAAASVAPRLQPPTRAPRIRLPSPREAREPTPGASLARNAPAGPRPKAAAAARPAVIPADPHGAGQTEVAWTAVNGRKANKTEKAAAVPQPARPLPSSTST